MGDLSLDSSETMTSAIDRIYIFTDSQYVRDYLFLAQ